jgi:hypothetical protein
MTGRAKTYAAVLFAALVSPTIAWALSLTPEHGIRGISTFCVNYVVLDDTPVPEGESAIEKDSVRELRRLGVAAEPFDRCSMSASSASVFLSVRGTPSSSGKLWAYVVTLELVQSGKLDRDPSLKLDSGVTTYSTAVVGLASADQLTVAISKTAVELARGFGKLVRSEQSRK